jgi:hypothetical protein
LNLALSSTSSPYPSSLYPSSPYTLSRIRPEIPLDPYHQQITDLALLGKSGEDISTVLFDVHGLEVTGRTINTRLREWGVSRPTGTPDALAIEELQLIRFTALLGSFQLVQSAQRIT